jgi:hypothetical protein
LTAAFLSRSVTEHHATSVVTVTRKQGRRARYLGLRKNLFDVRRVAAVLNLETIHLREIRKAA